MSDAPRNLDARLRTENAQALEWINDAEECIDELAAENERLREQVDYAQHGWKAAYEAVSVLWEQAQDRLAETLYRIAELEDEVR